MEKNFVVGQSNELLKDGAIYDLHNLYDFAELGIRSGARVEIAFRPNDDAAQDLPSLRLVFEGVDGLELSPGFGTRDIRDVDELGYKHPSDRDDSWLMTEQQATPLDHLFFRFSGEDFVRIHGQSARLEILEAGSCKEKCRE